MKRPALYNPNVERELRERRSRQRLRVPQPKHVSPQMATLAELEREDFAAEAARVGGAMARAFLKDTEPRRVIGERGEPVRHASVELER